MKHGGSDMRKIVRKKKNTEGMVRSVVSIAAITIIAATAITWIGIMDVESK